METVRMLLYKLSFRSRMTISFILVIAAAILVTSVMSYVIATRELEGNATSQSQETLSKTAQLLDEQLKGLLVSSLTLMISAPFTEMVNHANRGQSDAYYADLSALQTPFTQLKMTNPAVQSILISTPIGEFFPTSYYRNPSFSFAGSPMRQAIDARPGISMWVAGHEDAIFTGKDRVVSLVLRAFSQTNSDIYLVINVSESAIKRVVTSNLGSDSKHYFLVTDEGRYGFDPGTAPLIPEAGLNEWALASKDKPSAIYKQDGSEYLVNRAALKVAENWTLYSVQSKDKLFRQVERIKWLTIVIIGSGIAVAILISHVLTALLLRPLRALQRTIKQVGLSNLDVRYSSGYRDEVSQVGYKFNAMLDQIGILISELGEREKEKRIAEAKALQAQIDPHFLYNTLNTIVWVSESGAADETRRLIISLSRLFKLGLNQGLELTTLGLELEHVEHYLRLQQVSYEGLFDYEIRRSFDASLLDMPMVKIMLQPLVENSILHGFRDFTEGGRIVIDVADEGDSIRIAVTDNGAGMNAEEATRATMQEPQEGEAIEAGRKGYAMRNVYRRILLHYGERAEFLLESEPFVQTRITILLPLSGGNER